MEPPRVEVGTHPEPGSPAVKGHVKGGHMPAPGPNRGITARDKRLRRRKQRSRMSVKHKGAHSAANFLPEQFPTLAV